jgi:hypothetical protein
MLENDLVFKHNAEADDKILNDIIAAYKKFYKNFLGIANNFKRAPLLGNEFLTTTVRTKTFLTYADIAHVRLRNHNGYNMLKNITISKLTVNGSLISKTELENKIGTNIEQAIYVKLTGIYNTANLKYGSGPSNLGLNVTQSFRTWKKGSRRFRNVITCVKAEYVPHNLVKFATNTDTVITLNCSKSLGTVWTLRLFSNQMRTFLFKLYNNLLPYNTVLSHFVRGQSRNCTICDLVGNQEIHDERVLHLFYDCEPIYTIRTEFFLAITGGEVGEISRHELFCCFSRFDNDKNLLLGIAANIFINYVWECKKRQARPSLEHLRKFFSSEIKLMTVLSDFF